METLPILSVMNKYIFFLSNFIPHEETWQKHSYSKTMSCSNKCLLRLTKPEPVLLKKCGKNKEQNVFFFFYYIVSYFEQIWGSAAARTSLHTVRQTNSVEEWLEKELWDCKITDLHPYVRCSSAVSIHPTRNQLPRCCIGRCSECTDVCVNNGWVICRDKFPHEGSVIF